MKTENPLLFVEVDPALRNRPLKRRRQRRGHGAVPPRKYEKLIERGVRSIDTLSGGGLVSGPAVIKSGLVFQEKKLGGGFGRIGRRLRARQGARRFVRQARFIQDANDADGDGTVQDGTPYERPVTRAIKKVFNRIRKRRKNEIIDFKEMLTAAKDPDGGFTMHLGGLTNVKSGWAIARDSDGIVIPHSAMYDDDGEPTDEGIEILTAFVFDNKNSLFGAEDTATRTVALGAWHNPVTGLIHYDITDVFSKDSMTAEEAVEMGTRRDQISITDLDLLTEAKETGDWDTPDIFRDTEGKGGKLRDLDSYKPTAMRLRPRTDRKKPWRPSQETRTKEGPEGIEMFLAAGIKELAAEHGMERDWKGIVAIDPDRRKAIADFYDDAPDLSADEINEEARKAYEALSKEVEEQFKLLTEKLGVNVEFVDYDPYENFLEMREDFVENKRLLIMRTAVTGSHPFMTDEQNDMFRAVHDAFGHLAIGRGFDRHGEEAAYQAHRTMFSEEAIKALATETRGQNQYLLDRGEFGPQKLVILPEDMIKSLRMWLSLSFKKAMARAVRKAQSDNDTDNLYTRTRSHHVTGGRVLKTNR